MRKGVDTMTALYDMIEVLDSRRQEWIRMAHHSWDPREKAYLLRQANEAQQIAQWLREYMALREQVKKEAKK